MSSSNGDTHHSHSEPKKQKPAIAKKEVEENRRKTIILEQECEVYRSQLEVCKMTNAADG